MRGSLVYFAEESKLLQLFSLHVVEFEPTSGHVVGTTDVCSLLLCY